MKKFLMVCLVLAMTVSLFAGQVEFKQTGPLVGPVAKYLNAPMAMSGPGARANLPRVGTRDPRTLDDVIISEDFESYAGTWDLPTGWTQVDVDQGYCTQFSRNSTWGVFSYAGNCHSGTKIMANHYNDAALPNNDWLILPVQNLQSPITLSYWEAAQDPLYAAESWEIKVSTTGTQPADFTHLIYSHTDADTAWHQYSHDLSAYAGAPMYIAIHYNATDQFIIKIDDLLLEAGAAGPHGSVSGVVTDAATTQPLANAIVTCSGATADTTDATGHYFIASASVGNHIMNFSHAGYTAQTDSNVAVADGDTTVINKALTPQPAGINDDFESYAGTWDLPTGWTQVDVDQGYCTQFARNSTWGVWTYTGNAHSGSKIMANHYNDAALPNNDWLILPQQNFSGTITLSYWEAAQDPLYAAESWEIKVSTTGTLPANFTHLIYSHTDADTAWHQYTHDLSAYAGAPFYVAIHYNATDQFVIKIDDLSLTGGAASPSGTISGVVHNSQGDVPLANVTVAVEGTALTATTNVSGAYLVAAVPVGNYTVRFTKVGFDTLEHPNAAVVNGDTTVVNVSMDPNSAVGDGHVLPLSFAFDGNYPNPFNSQTDFRFSIPRSSPVELVLYNVNGQEVARVVNGVMAAGSHTVSFNASNLTSGVYLARLTASGMTATRKMMLLK